MSETALAPAPLTEATTVSLPPVASLLDDHAPPDGAVVEQAVLGEAADSLAEEADEGAPQWGRWQLPAVTMPDNLRLQTAVARLVVQKQRIDTIVREGQLDGLWPVSWLGLDGRSIDLSAFVQSVLPFIPENGQGQVAAGRVNLKYTLGDDSRWGRSQVSRPRALAERLAADERAIVGKPDMAEVSLISPLGLCVPTQGKSRVGFLRQMGAASMAARVTALAYPSPSQLALYTVAPGGHAQVWCVLGQRQLRRLEAHWLSVPLLNGYGVAEPKPWPESWPPEDAVAQCLADCRGKCVPEVDLVALSQRLTREAQGMRWVSTNLLQMRNWVPRWRFFLASFIGLPAVFLVLAMLALPRAIEAAAVAAILGFAGGAVAALAVPWVIARQRDVN